MLELDGWHSTEAPTAINANHIDQLIVNTVEYSVFRNVRGTVNLSPQAVELLRLIDRHGGEGASALQTAVHELEDPDARPADRRKAKKRLVKFLSQVGKVTQDVAIEILEKYLEKRLGM